MVLWYELQKNLEEKDGSYIRFDDNAVVIVDKKKKILKLVVFWTNTKRNF